MLTFTDQLNRTLTLKSYPKRIISLVPSQTELLSDLGLENSIVGVTKFCVHPNHIKDSKTVVGGTKQIHLDKIRALKPDIILCNKEENTKAMIPDLEAIAPVHISDIYTLEDSLELIGLYGQLFNVEASAQNIIAAINKQKLEFESFISDKPLKTVAYFIWKTPWMVAANNTFINYLLVTNKFENTFGHLNRYPEINIENSNVSPDYIFLSSEPYPFKTKHKNELKTYFPNSEIVLVDGEMFSWYGSRLEKAFTYFKSLRENLFFLS